MKRKTWLALATVGAIAAMTLAGCSNGSATGGGVTGDSVKQNPKAPITVWVDDTRTAPAKAYAKAHPSLHATVETIDNTPGSNASKIALTTKAGKGVPDVVFLSYPDEISSMLANPVNFPLPLTGNVPTKILNGFAKGTLARCTFGGKVYCLPNDIAQTVMFYNKTLFAKFGYTVPTTMDEWLALGQKLATEHPGYSLGAVGDRYGLGAYYGSSGCKFEDSTDPTTVTIDVSSTACTRVNDVLGPLIKNGTLSTLDPFDKAFTPVVASGKLLATLSPSWMGAYGIKPSFATKGQFAVAPMPTWPGAKVNYSGAVGGGIWLVSARSKNVAAALKFAEAMSTNTSIQVKSSGYPAYAPAAKAWLASTAADPWYASDPSAVLIDAAGKINTTQGYVRYDAQAQTLFSSTVLKSASAGDIASGLQDFGTQLTQAAQSLGYKVIK